MRLRYAKTMSFRPQALKLYLNLMRRELDGAFETTNRRHNGGKIVMKMTKHEIWGLIRLQCLECAETPSGVRNCTITNCSLMPYRFGEIWAADRATFGSNFDFSKKAMIKAVRSLCQYCLSQKYPKCPSSVCHLKPILGRALNANVNP